MTSYRSTWWWVSVLFGGLAVAMALAVLKVGASAPAAVRLTGATQGAQQARSYDIVVTAPGPGGPGNAAGWTATPAQLDTLYGGITLAQYQEISRLPGVEVAAPLTMVGYVPFTVSAPMAIPASVRSAKKPQGVTITVRLRSDNGLSTVTWDDVTIAYPQLRPSTLSIKLSWTFQLPLIAVDPAAEARLLHLDGAVTSGSYLPETPALSSGPVPMLMAGSLASDEAAQVTVDPAQAGPPPSGPQPGAVTGGTATLTTASAYQQLVDEARTRTGTISNYWTAGPVSYAQAADGVLEPQSVDTSLAGAWDGAYQWAGAPGEAGALDVPFRSLTEHTAITAAASVRAVGIFDPARVASTPGTPSPYVPEMLTGADARSRQLLGGRPLAAGGDPGGYPGSAASLIVPLADVGTFTSGFRGANDAAPVGTIRVRVAGAAGDTAASQDRISAVAQEIVRATGLHVQAVLGSTATTRVVDLPAGLHGRPALLVDEVWYHSDVRTTVWSGLGQDSMVLSALVLLAGEVVLAWGTWQVMRGRRSELATLRALGWQRRQLGWKLLAEFALAAVVGAAAATLAGYTVGALIGRHEWAWLLGIAAVGAAVLFGTWRTRRQAKAVVLAEPRRGGQAPRLTTWRQGGTAIPFGAVRSLLRSPARTLLSTFVIAVAAVALSLGLAARWAFSGAVTPWTLRPLTSEGAVVNAAAVLLALLLAMFTVADLNSTTLREHAAELRTLRALGWRAQDLARLMTRNALLPGLAGGLAGGAFDLLAGLPVAGSAPLRLIALVGIAAAAGIAMSALAACVPVLFTVHLRFAHPYHMLTRRDG
jgi:hypothetical protein